MKSRGILTLILIATLALSLTACGVPKEEHEKVVKELEQANQDKTTLSRELDQVKGEKESLSKQVAELQNQVNTLKEENEQLKAKLAPKKPAQKAPARKR